MTERNLLGEETSPYLLQHADNPVHWQPWGETALLAARDHGKPILLSVGYSACHWCHVMAHESFEDQDTADLMNALFINIKVDREERPDIDRIYQTAHQLITRRAGGWPLTMFLTPADQTPFFGGTYFPGEARHGLPSFKELLVRVEEYFREHRQDIGAQREAIHTAMQSLEPQGRMQQELDARPLAAAREQLEAVFDARHGGFGGAPKFPHPSNLERLLRHYATARLAGRDDAAARAMLQQTLECMANGGLFDHLGGGFSRYSVDAEWMIPHFEKMLYDNGPLLGLYAQAFQLRHDQALAGVCHGIAAWVMREMQDPLGGYYSSVDADSEGEEGKFYVWTPEQVQASLSVDEYRVFSRRFGLDRAANFEGRAWHLYAYQSLSAVARNGSLDEAQVTALLAAARDKLFRIRSTRVHPGLDDKVLCSWNALMIKGMAVAGRTLEQPEYLDSAERALDFVHRNLWRDGHLLATSKDGHAHLNAYLDDYALLIDAVLSMLECRWRDGDLEFCLALADRLLDQFMDLEHGGFYFTSRDHEPLFHRNKPMSDDALPSGNGIAARTLGRLGHLLGETRYLQAAEDCLRNAWEGIQQFPHAHNSLLDALEEVLEPPLTVIIRGRGRELERWQRRALVHYAPHRLCLAIPEEAAELPALLAERRPADTTIAYVCHGHHCDAPITDFAEYAAVLEKSEISPTD